MVNFSTTGLIVLSRHILRLPEHFNLNMHNNISWHYSLRHYLSLLDRDTCDEVHVIYRKSAAYLRVISHSNQPLWLMRSELSLLLSNVMFNCYYSKEICRTMTPVPGVRFWWFDCTAIDILVISSIKECKGMTLHFNTGSNQSSR
jgi:hypothetical protein